MGILNLLKNRTIAERKSEEQLFAIAAQEIAEGNRNEALWLKALALADGNSEKQLSEYIKLRVQALKDDLYIYEQIEKERSNRFSPNSIVPAWFDPDDFIEMIKSGKPLSVIKKYLNTSGSDDLPKLINMPDSIDELPLHAAIKKNRIDVVEWLLENGANIGARNYWGKTANQTLSDETKKEIRLLLFRKMGR